MIELYITEDLFLFESDGKKVGEMPLSTLELSVVGRPSEHTLSHMRYMAAEYVAGQIFKSQLGVVVLGPPRAFTHEVTLRAYGNPDHHQYDDIGPRKTVRCCGIQEARDIFRAYQERHDMGAGNCGPEHGVVWELPKSDGGKRKKIGAITYGGRFETVAEIKAWQRRLRSA